MAKKAKRGRPKSARNKDVDIVPIKRVRCVQCDSVARTKYQQRRSLDVSGISPEGYIFRQVIWRRCQCKACGQWRDEKEYVRA